MYWQSRFLSAFFVFFLGTFFAGMALAGPEDGSFVERQAPEAPGVVQKGASFLAALPLYEDLAATLDDDLALEDFDSDDVELGSDPHLVLRALSILEFGAGARSATFFVFGPALTPPPALVSELVPESTFELVTDPLFSLLSNPGAGPLSDGSEVKPTDILQVVPAQGPISSEFGSRVLIAFSRPRMHKGVDIKAERGSPVVAAGPGRVIFAGRNGTYGVLVRIDHGHNLVTCYAHMDKCLVKVGQELVAGEKLGLVGRTGRTTGANLHFEVRVNGECINPREVFAWADSPPRKNSSRPLFKPLDLPPLGADLIKRD